MIRAAVLTFEMVFWVSLTPKFQRKQQHDRKQQPKKLRQRSVHSCITILSYVIAIWLARQLSHPRHSSNPPLTDFLTRNTWLGPQHETKDLERKFLFRILNTTRWAKNALPFAWDFHLNLGIGKYIKQRECWRPVLQKQQSEVDLFSLSVVWFHVLL